jgi:hypothetical protein
MKLQVQDNGPSGNNNTEGRLRLLRELQLFAVNIKKRQRRGIKSSEAELH